jgi:hypothetical protein
VLIVLAITTVMVLVHLVHRRDAFSPLAMSAVFYLLAYGLGTVYILVLYRKLPPSALTGTLRVNLTDHSIITALFVATLAWVLFVVGYVLRPFRLVLNVAPSLAGLSRARSPATTVITLLGLGWLDRILLVGTGRYFHSTTREVTSSGSNWIISNLALLPTLATALCGAYAYTIKDARRGRFQRAYWVLWVIELAWAIPTAERGQIVGIFLMGAVIRYYGSGKGLPWKAVLVAGALLVFVAFPFGLAYRSKGSGYETDSGRALRNAARQTFSQPVGTIATNGLAATFSRFSDAASLAAVFDTGRHAFLHAPGETLRWSIEGFIPRALDPSRGDPGNFGNEFGRSFGIVPSNDFSTSISATQPGELYLNYGILGVILFMPFVGGAYRLLGDYCGERRRDAASLAFYAVLAWPIASSQETILSNGLTGIFKALIALALIVAVVAKVPDWISPRRTASRPQPLPTPPAPRGLAGSTE